MQDGFVELDYTFLVNWTETDENKNEMVDRCLAIYGFTIVGTGIE
jgi:hypothetical protein